MIVLVEGIAMWKMAPFAALIGFLVDLVLGDPHWLYHPVRLIGNFIGALEKILRFLMPKGKVGQLVGGGLMASAVVFVCTAVSYVILRAAYGYSFAVGFALESFMCYQMVATKSLKVESMRVYEALKDGDLSGGRRAVSMIVGRDTDCLDEEGVSKAAVETVAENTSDGVIAPLLFMIIGGAAAGFAYKSVNTMDSMVGYKNEKYLYFGRAAAKLDDLVNFLPARIAALIMIAATGLCGLSKGDAMKIYLRDRRKHASPNSAQTEAVMAGALGVRLAGDGKYFGKIIRKPTIGDAKRGVEAEDIVRANRLMYAAAGMSATLFFALAVMARFVFGLVIG